MLRRETPLAWRRGFALYRRRLETDALGEQRAVYPEEPDYTAEDGTAEGICFQYIQSWQNSGRLTSGWMPREQGEMPVGILEGRLFSDLAIAPFDRLRVGDALYEVRSVQRWQNHRKLLAQQIE